MCIYKRLISLLLLLAAVFSMAGTALADYTAGNNPAPPLGVEAAVERARQFNLDLEGMSPEEIAAKYNVDLYLDVYDHYGNYEIPGNPVTVTEGETWREVMDALLSKYEVDEYRVGIGYYNTLTGEEQYINGDKYMISASMFKIPTNMIIADRVSSGEITMEEEIAGAPYSYHQYQTIVNSDNARWMDLINYLGGYSKFKELQIPYLGNDPVEELGWNYQVDNYYNSKQFIHMLRTLYDDPERFPGIIECMLEATPFSDFKQYEKRNPIAQKYGFVEQSEADNAWHTYITCCGIVYSDTPFMIVMFTDNVDYAYSFLGEYAVVMTDYTNMVAAQEQKKAEEAEAEARAKAEAEAQAKLEAEKKAAEEAASLQAQAEATPEPTELPKTLYETIESRTFGRFSAVDCIVMLWIAIAVLICLVIIFRTNQAGKINGFWAGLAAIFAGLSMTAAVIGLNMGTVIAQPGGEPTEPVISFFESIKRGDYDGACKYLSDYESFGLNFRASTEQGNALLDVLKSSYDYYLRGSCVKDGITATQNVAFKYVNLSKIKEDAAARINPYLKEIAEGRPNSKVYDSEGNYLQSVTDEVYEKAMADAIANAENYYTSAEFTVNIDYIDGQWLMQTPGELITALAGGTQN